MGRQVCSPYNHRGVTIGVGGAISKLGLLRYQCCGYSVPGLGSLETVGHEYEKAWF